jgi:hypothetical protein
MADASNFVSRTCSQITRFMEEYERLNARLKEYQSIGGADALDSHFLVNGQPREDIKVSKVQFVASVSSIIALVGLMETDNHEDNFNQARG